MISDVKPGSTRAKVYHRNLARGLLKGNSLQGEKSRALGFSEKIGSFLLTSPHSTKFGSYVTTLIEGLNYGMTTIIRALQ